MARPGTIVQASFSYLQALHCSGVCGEMSRKTQQPALNPDHPYSPLSVIHPPSQCRQSSRHHGLQLFGIFSRMKKDDAGLGGLSE